MRRSKNLHHRSLDAFSLVEVLAAVTIIGVIIFLAIPNIIKIREDSEQSLAKSRASALNIAAASYFQARGPTDALAAWTDQSTASRYDLIKSYLAFAPPSFAEYMPKGFDLEFSVTAPHREAASLYWTNNAGVRTNLSY
jgi:prepilin-type N-terminal cleavage/methylation domain-containing protein